MGITTASAKLLLMGEHAAVYGSPAVGLGLPWPFTVHYQPSLAWELPGTGPHEPLLRRLLAQFEAARATANQPPLAPGRLTFESRVPLASGFGSSGALCAALARLFFPDEPLEVLDQHAWQAEKLFHGTPSGIDTVLALRPGWWELLPGQTPPLALELPAPAGVLVVGAVRRESDTKALVGGLARRRADGDQLVRAGLGALGQLAADAVECLRGEAGRPPLATLIQNARTELARLGLETPALSTVLDEGLRQGASAGKLSGAGGGGAFFVLFADAPTADAALAPLEASLPPGEWVLRPQRVETRA